MGSRTQSSIGESVIFGSQWAVEREPAAVTASRTATLGGTTELASASGVSTLPAAQKGSRTSTAGDSTVTGLPGDSSSKSQRRQRHPKGGSDSPTSRPRRADSMAKGSSSAGESLKRLPPGRSQRLSDKSTSAAKVKRLVLLTIAGLVGLGILGFVLIGTLSWLQKTFRGISAPALEGEQPLVQLSQPPVPIPEAGSQMTAPEGPLTEETAQQAIQAWLSTKSLALGPDHQVGQPEKILAPPVLSVWQQRAQIAKQENSYWQYDHTVKVNSVAIDKANSDRARVDAAVREGARFYKGGNLDESASYNDNLRVRYDLVRKEGRWLITEMAVVR